MNALISSILTQLAALVMNWGAVAGRHEGFEYDLALLGMALFLALAGPGQFTIVN